MEKRRLNSLKSGQWWNSGSQSFLLMKPSSLDPPSTPAPPSVFPAYSAPSESIVVQGTTVPIAGSSSTSHSNMGDPPQLGGMEKSLTPPPVLPPSTDGRFTSIEVIPTLPSEKNLRKLTKSKARAPAREKTIPRNGDSPAPKKRGPKPRRPRDPTQMSEEAVASTPTDTPQTSEGTVASTSQVEAPAAPKPRPRPIRARQVAQETPTDVAGNDSADPPQGS